MPVQNPLAIVVVLCGVILLSLKLCARFPWAAKLSPVIWVLFLGAAASNLRLIPTQSDLYLRLIEFSMPLAVCLVLFRVNLADVRNAGKSMLIAFGLASAATVAGVLVAGLALEPLLFRILGEDSWKLAGPYTGTYVGGSLNFFALWGGLEIGEPDLFAAANAVDNVTIFPLYAVWILVPAMLASWFPVGRHWRVPSAKEVRDPETTVPPRLIPSEVATVVFTALAIILVSDWIKTALLDRVLPQVPAILIVTTLALACGQLGFIRRIESTWELGHLAFYAFFAAVGAMINLYNAVVLAPALFGYVMIVMVVHLLLIYGAGRALKMDVRVLTIASAAAKSGPAVVLALTQSRAWKALALPGTWVFYPLPGSP